MALLWICYYGLPKVYKNFSETHARKPCIPSCLHQNMDTWRWHIQMLNCRTMAHMQINWFTRHETFFWRFGVVESQAFDKFERLKKNYTICVQVFAFLKECCKNKAMF